MEKRQKSLRVVDVHVREIAHWHLAESIPEQLVFTLEDGTERTLSIGNRSVPHGVALLSDEPPTENDIARAHELSAKYGWED